MNSAHVDDSGACVVYRDGVQTARLGISQDGMFTLALAMLEADLAQHVADMPRDQVARLAGRMVERWAREQIGQHLTIPAQRPVP